MTQEQKNLIYKMLLKIKFALSSNDEDIGKAKVPHHKIILINKAPIWQKPRRFLRSQKTKKLSVNANS